MVDSTRKIGGGAASAIKLSLLNVLDKEISGLADVQTRGLPCSSSDVLIFIYIPLELNLVYTSL